METDRCYGSLIPGVFVDSFGNILGRTYIPVQCGVTLLMHKYPHNKLNSDPISNWFLSIPFTNYCISFHAIQDDIIVPVKQALQYYTDMQNALEEEKKRQKTNNPKTSH